MTKGKGQGKISRVLLMRLEHIGDVLLMMPAINALRLRFPDAIIDVAVGEWSFDTIKLNAQVNNIILFNHPLFARNGKQNIFKVLINSFRFIQELRRREYDAIIDFRSNLSTLLFTYLSGAKTKIGFDIGGRGRFLTEKVPFDEKKHQVDLNSELVSRLGVKGKSGEFELIETLDDKKALVELMKTLDIDEGEYLIAIYPSAAWKPRRWDIGNYIKLVEWLYDSYEYKLLFIGSKEDRQDFNSIFENVREKARSKMVNAMGISTLSLTAMMLRKCAVFIGADSGPMHLAALLGVPVVALMGPGEYPRFAPYGKNHIVIRKDIGCNPCRQTPGVEQCKRGENLCMKSISLEDVKKAIWRQLSQPRGNK